MVTTGVAAADGRDDHERGRSVLKVENESLEEIGVGRIEDTGGIEANVEESGVG